MALGARLWNHVIPSALGEVWTEVGFVLASEPDTVRAPDASFIQATRVPIPRPTGYIPVIPDLVVEVVSPNDLAYEVNEKRNEWLEAGAQLVWVIDPEEQTIHDYRLDGTVTLFRRADTLTAEAVLPEFRVPVADLFRLPTAAA